MDESNHSTRSILVTGGAGFIGSHFARAHLIENPNDRVVVLDILNYASHRFVMEELSRSSNKFVFQKGDICNQSLVEELLVEYQIDTVVNFAAQSHVDRSISEPLAFVNTNVGGTVSLLNAARKVWKGRYGDNEFAGNKVRFHQISTDEVFGPIQPTQMPAKENSPYNPSSPYSASKAAADQFVFAFGTTYTLPVSISYSSNTFGSYQHREKLIPKAIACVVHNRPIPLYGDGSQRRVWLHVSDHVRAVGQILNSSTKGRAFNVRGQTELTNLKLLTMVCDYIDALFQSNSDYWALYPRATCARDGRSSTLISCVEDRLGHDFRYDIDDTLIKTDLGFVHQGNFNNQLEETIKWYLDNPNFLEID